MVRSDAITAFEGPLSALEQRRKPDNSLLPHLHGYLVRNALRLGVLECDTDGCCENAEGITNLEIE